MVILQVNHSEQAIMWTMKHNRPSTQDFMISVPILFFIFFKSLSVHLFRVNDGDMNMGRVLQRLIKLK